MEKLGAITSPNPGVFGTLTLRRNGSLTPSGDARQPSKIEFMMLLRIAKALMSAVNVGAALRSIYQNLSSLKPDGVLLISNRGGGDSCYYLDPPQGKKFLEMNHQECRKLRKMLEQVPLDRPAGPFMLDHGSHVVAPFTSDVHGGYIALQWKRPPSLGIQRGACTVLPFIAELAGIRLTTLFHQLNCDELVHEQHEAHAAAESRLVEELRVSESEAVVAREMAAQDELTGLQNRRGFLAKSEQCLLIARRQRLACAVIFADVDGLKSVNDKLGHAAGDDLIREAARLFRSAFRQADVVGRVGGDEFAAFTFDNATPRAITERILGRIAEFNLVQPSGHALSLSIGVINCDSSSDESLSDYLLRADNEMYRDKRLGRGETI